jgi:hypothetical protein
LVAKEAESRLEPNEGVETPEVNAVPPDETVYHLIWCALMFVADAVRSTEPAPHRNPLVKVKTGVDVLLYANTMSRVVVPHAF